MNVSASALRDEGLQGDLADAELRARPEVHLQSTQKLKAILAHPTIRLTILRFEPSKPDGIPRNIVYKSAPKHIHYGFPNLR